MARINIEECWWSDPRRTDLLLSIGFEADSAAVNMWRVAQEFWGKGRALVPREVFMKIKHAQALLAAGLASEQGDMIYARGSSQYLEWHAEKREAARAGGKKSAQRTRNAKGQLQKASKQKPSKTQAESKLSQASGSLSLSDSPSGLDSAVVAIAPDAATPDKDLNKAVWDSYSLAYFERYGTEPVRNLKVNSQVSQLAKRLGQEAPDVVRFYLGHSKSFYISNMHSIGICLADAEALRTQWATGQKVTQRQARQADDAAAVGDQLARIRSGQLGGTK